MVTYLHNLLNTFENCSLDRAAVDEILEGLESMGMQLVEQLEVVPWEPEEGWDIYLQKQDEKAEARDFHIAPRLNPYKNTYDYEMTTPMIIANRYLWGESIKDLANAYNVPRERIRQIIAKERRRYQNWKKSQQGSEDETK
jgi:hypothetical protein